MAEHMSTTCVISYVEKSVHCCQIRSMREFCQFLSGKMNCQPALSSTIIHADQHLLTRKNYQSFLLQMVIRILNKFIQGKQGDVQTRGFQFFPATVYFEKKEKCKPKSSTREKTQSFMEFRADDRVIKALFCRKKCVLKLMTVLKRSSWFMFKRPYFK